MLVFWFLSFLDPRNLSRGLYISIPIVTVCYVSVNMAYYAGLSKTELLSSPATALVSLSYYYVYRSALV